ncbi:MAG: 30S ribosomal protein S20 [bacterium]|nr:30S ribosomal protein S20 [bacterium]
MPITRSAKKAWRQSITRRASNNSKKKTLKEAVKAYKKAPSAELLSKVFQQLDKSAKVNVIKKNTASRLKSRLSKRLVAKS